MKKLIQISVFGLLITLLSTSCQKKITASFGASSHNSHAYISKEKTKTNVDITEKEMVQPVLQVESAPSKKEELISKVAEIKTKATTLATNTELTRSEKRELKKDLKTDLKELKEDAKSSSKNSDDNTLLIVLLVLLLLLLLGGSLFSLLYLVALVVLIFLLLRLFGVV